MQTEKDLKVFMRIRKMQQLINNNYFSFLCYYCKRQITINRADQLWWSVFLYNKLSKGGMLLNKIGKILKQERKMLVNTLIVADVCLIILFILLAILGSPYQSWDYSDPEWSVIGTLWYSFEWVYFKVAPLMVIVITAILGIIFVKRNK